MDRKQKKEFLIIAVGLLVLLSCMSFLLRSCSNQKAKQAQQRISTQQKIKQDKKEESTEKADTKKEEEKEQEDNKLRDLDGNEIKNGDTKSEWNVQIPMQVLTISVEKENLL